MDKKNQKQNKYITLKEAAQYCDYSQDYLSLRARQKKLKAVKFGKNWMTKREWLEEYLKEPSNYISLKQAAQYCDYSQDYLSLRARQKKLKAVKFGKNWLTKREWLKDYLAENKKHIKQLEEFQIVEEPKASEEPTPSTLIPLITKMLRTGVLSVLILTLLVSGATAGRNLFFKNFLPHVIKVHEISGKFINNLVLPIIENSPALKSVVLNIAAVQETASDIFRDYFSWLGNSFGSIFSKLIKTYLVIHNSFDEKTQQGLEVMKDFFSYLSGGIKSFFSYFSEAIRNFFARGEIPTDGLLTEQAFIETEERLTEKLIQAFQHGFEKLQKEGIPSKEIIREIRIEPIKEITKEIRTIDSASLVQLRSDIEYVKAELADRLYAPGGIITQEIYITEPIQSPRIYQENGDIVLQTLGSGNILLSAATSLQLHGQQVVIGSTSVSNPLIYLANETSINGPLTAERITLNAPDGYTGNILDVDSKFTVNSTGATLIGNFTITGNLSVTGNQTLAGTLSLTASSTSPVLVVTQQGTGYGAVITGGNVGIATSAPQYTLDVWGSARFGATTDSVLFVDSGTGRVGIATTTPSQALHVVGNILGSGNAVFEGILDVQGYTTSTFAGPLQITTTTQPQLVVRYDSTNYLTGSVSSAGLTSLVSTGGLNLTGAGSSIWQTTNYGSLTIQSASSTEIVSGDTLTATSTGDMILATAGQERVRILTSGYVGIATSTPSAQLAVTGNVMIDGDLKFVDDQTIEGSGTLTINPTGNLYFQSASNYIDELGNLVLAGNLTSPKTISPILEYAGNITINATSSVATTVTIINEDGRAVADLVVEGDIQIDGGKITLASGETIDAETSNNIKINSDDLTIIYSSTNEIFRVSVDGIKVTGQATTTDTLYVSSGGADITGNVTISGELSTTATTTLATSEGNVGIGTASPDAKLEVAGNVKLSAGTYNYIYTSSSDGSDNQQLALLPYGSATADGSRGSMLLLKGNEFATTPGGVYLASGIDTSGGIELKERGTGGISLKVANSDTTGLFIVNSGSVGIATTTPAHPFVVNSAASSAFVVQSDGRVGIGTTGPGAKLDVSDGTYSIQIDPSTWSISSVGKTEILLKANSQNILRGLDGWTSTWSDSATTTYFQVGRQGGNTAFSTLYGTAFNRFAFITNKFQITNSTSNITPPTNYFQIDYGDNNLVSVQSTGNVGIGTTAPASLLELYKNTSAQSNPILTITNASTTADIDPTLTFKKSTTDEWKIYMDDSDSDKFKIATTTADVLTIDQSGNVGIGTTNPSNPLEVIGNANAIRFGDQDNVANTGILVAGATFYGFRDGDGADTLTILQSNGNVGIATTTPSYKLHVWGSAGFGTSTTPTLFVDSGTGRVGIGTTEPSQLLHIKGAGGTDVGFRIGTDDAAQDAIIELATGLNSYVKTAIVAEGISSNRRANLHFVVDSAADANSYTLGTDTKMFISYSGNVGIGTTAPVSLLELYKNTSTQSNPILTITNASTTADIDPTLTFKKSTTDEWKIYMDDSDSDKLKIATTTADVFTIDQSGNVGIATTTPSYKLHVWGSAGFGTSTTPTLFVDSGTGRVGIASSTPIEALTVQGNIFSTGSLTIGGHLMPTDPRTQDIGSDDYDWRDIYVDNVYANNINAASSTIAGTSAGTFTINSDTASDATSSLRFYRGTESPHALLAWDAGYDRFNLNFPLYLSATGNNITASGALTLYSGNSLNITLDSAGKIVLQDDTDINANLDVSGSLTVGSADQFYIDSSGNATTTGVFYAAAFRSASDDATIRKSGDQIVRGVVPIFGFDLPARTASSSYTQVSRYIENDAFPSAYSGTARKYKFAIRYADATTTVASMWQIATSSDASSFTFTVPFSDTIDLAKGNAYITDTTSLPALPWRLDVKTGGSGDYSIQVYDIVLIAVDEVN